MRLNVKAFALTCGLIWGLGLFVLTWWVIIMRGQVLDPNFWSTVYIGFNFTPMGSVFGLVWGLVDGAIGGVIFAWLYNLLARAFEKTPVASQESE